MKNLIVVLAIAAISHGVLAHAGDKKDKKPAVKEHVCTTACKDGNHAYAHGEKGHVCTEACKLKEHVCTDACKDGNHVYAHGEKGHVCTDACKKKM